ncbi:MAG: hypothetical protein ACPG5B_05775 [Chitinophagales bacterium]
MKKTLTFLSLLVLVLFFVQCEKDKNFYNSTSERIHINELPVFEFQPPVLEQQETDYFNLTQTLSQFCYFGFIEPFEMETSIEEVFYNSSENSIDITIHANILIDGGSIFENYHFRINGLSEGIHNISEDVTDNYCFVAMSILPPATQGQGIEIDEFFETGSITITELTDEYFSGFYSVNSPLDNVGNVAGDFQISY